MSTTFPFQTFEPLKGDGYDMQGRRIEVDVTFIRYLEDDDVRYVKTVAGDYMIIDSIVESDDVKSYCDSRTLRRVRK